MISTKLQNIANELSNNPVVKYGMFADNIALQKYASIPYLVWINPLKVGETSGQTPFHVTVDVEIFFFERSSVDCPEDLRASQVDAQRIIAYEYLTRLQNDRDNPLKVGSWDIQDKFIVISKLHLSGVSLTLSGKYKPDIKYCYGSN